MSCVETFHSPSAPLTDNRAAIGPRQIKKIDRRSVSAGNGGSQGSAPLSRGERTRLRPAPEVGQLAPLVGGIRTILRLRLNIRLG